MPETYFYNFNSPASNILIKSQDSFIEYAQLLWKKKQPSNPLKTLDEAIILASIVEKEAGNNKEKPIIAGVFLNRLNLNMRLQADPTIIYGLLPNFNGNITKLNLQDSSNRYNTYKIKGLPPTPIAMISKSSLEAVILGIPNNYVYFVAKGDGTHYFSTNYADHLKAVRKFQIRIKLMKIISFEGIEGVGKSTQINMLNDYLKAKGMKTEILREPGSTDIGEKIRDILLNSSDEIADEAELLLMFASRAQLINEKVLESNLDFILFDRFYDASIAYQGYGRGLSLDLITNLISFINCPVPEITFLLDIRVEDGFSRKVNDVKDRIESSGLVF